MDEIKDIQKSQQEASPFDESPVRTQPFGANVSAERAYGRAEKIVTALYLLTNHIAPEEPARVSLRETGNLLLKNILLLRDEMRSAGSTNFKDTIATIRHAISLIRILGASGYISAQNMRVMVEATDELGNFLNASQRTTLSESHVFSKDEFLAGGVPERRALKDIKDSEYKKDKTQSKMSDIIGHKSDLSDVRANGIVNVLKSQGELGIKDISSSLPEYSEKMIQRELARLVDQGQVQKTGSKRWSRYSLAK